MKNTVLMAGALLVAMGAFAQKKEIKKADKALQSGDYNEAMTYLSQAEPMLGSADDDEKADFYLIRAGVMLGKPGADFSQYAKAGEDLEKAKAADPSIENDDAYAQTFLKLREKMENSAMNDFNSKNFKMAAEKYEKAYALSKSDTIFLANAAISAKNGQDYDMAVKFYNQLLDIGYTGIQSQLVATNKETGEEEAFGSVSQRDLMLKAGTHTNPRTKVSENQQEDIVRNLTQIYIQQGKTEKALDLLKGLRAKNPDDMILLRTEADLYYEMGDKETYNKLISELIAKDPENPELYFNLGVASAENGNVEKAMEYYREALKRDPGYASANINMASLILDKQTPIVEEMNALGTSREDFKKYDALKIELTKIQESSVPYLEAAFQARPDNVEYARTLMNIYSQLGQEAKASAMKAKVQELEGQ
ncbi:tetratricopeptide repeat protein [Altibacter sp.]|uniref:tetratricopeptide repeat protein n=1 Tax=Altibacter sp. TaxID=2024823 RepID=UPI0025BB4C6D|nr:tetratricopeptide repeat protein [Altibacter sp.]